MQRDPLPARRRFTRLAGSADALALARLAQEEHPIAVVSATALDAQRLVDEIAWFSPQLRTCLLPDWETLPYDQFSPHHDLVSERLATLYRIQRGEFDVAIVPASTALVRMCPPAYIAAHTFFLRTTTELNVEQLKQQLATAGYQHVTQVVAPGEFCVRGGLIDLFDFLLHATRAGCPPREWLVPRYRIARARKPRTRRCSSPSDQTPA